MGLRINTQRLSSPEKPITFLRTEKNFFNEPDSSQYMTMVIDFGNQESKQETKPNPSNLGKEIFEIEKQRPLNKRPLF